MALNNNLLASWNFDKVTGSNSSGEFTVLDVSNEFNGAGVAFSGEDSSFILKEYVKTNKKSHFDSLESADAIQIVSDTDDLRTTEYNKPSSLKLVLENSMFQIVSDDILNMFSSISDYTFKFAEPYNKYKTDYNKLEETRKIYFSNINSNPNLEKYLEFYKWLDSSLGAMLDQLKPESTNTIQGLKNTVESHILERNKFQHKLPLTFQPNRLYSSGVTVINVNSTANSSVQKELTSSVGVVYSSDQSEHRNKNLDSIQSAGKQFNNRGNKTNKTIIQTNFSAGDGLSEINRHPSFEEFSVYNILNNRAKSIKDIFNASQAASINVQGSNTATNFADNNFVQRNIPYIDENFSNLNTSSYMKFSTQEALFRQRNNLIVDVGVDEYEVIETPIQFSLPAKHNLKVQDSKEEVFVYSPYKAKIQKFSDDVENKENLISYFETDVKSLNASNLFLNKINELSESNKVSVSKIEILENIYPRKNLMGRAETRTKPKYEELAGTISEDTLLWSDNSYNNNSAKIRTFWKDSLEDRKRTRGADFPAVAGAGSINCVNTYNFNEFLDEFKFRYLRTGTPSRAQYSYPIWEFDGITFWGGFDLTLVTQSFNSVFSLDSSGSFPIQQSIAGTDTWVSFTIANNTVGDLAPYNHFEQSKFLISQLDAGGDLYAKAKPQFIFNNFYEPIAIGTEAGGVTDLNLYYNSSYQNFSDPNIVPFYNSYEDYFANIKHKSHNYSIVPEYIYSDLNNGTGDYLKILGRERFAELNESDEYFLGDFNKFINKNSNKIKINFNGIKKLLPYNGFYPAQRTTQIANYFYESYLSSSNPSDALTERQKQTILQPFFAPGILFNTIKAGLAVDFPIVVTSSASPSYSDTYEFTNKITTAADPVKQYYNVNNVKVLNERIPFEAILDPKQYFIGPKSSLNVENKLLYLDSSHHNGLITGSNTLVSSPYVLIENINKIAIKNSDKFYVEGINNFFAEIPNFFLENSSLTYFSSKPETEFNFKSGSVYEATIEINKNDLFNMFRLESWDETLQSFYLSSDYQTSSVFTSLFGPRVFGNYYLGDDNKGTHYPYSPSYYTPLKADNGVKFNQIKLFYTASQTGAIPLSSIFPNIQILTASDETAGYAFQKAMSLDASLNYIQKAPVRENTFDLLTGQPSSTTDRNQNYKWVIQTKFETPLIDYGLISTSSLKDPISTFSISGSETENGAADYATPINVNVKELNISGIWNSYGSIPLDGNGVSISLIGPSTEENLSLLDAVGFKVETKNIGVLAESKEISEAVVLLPFVENYQTSRDDSLPYSYNKIENKYLFKIPENVINSVLKVSNYKSLSIENIKNILETNVSIDKSNSVIDLMIKMVNYNIPSHLNWLFDKGVTPCVMYIAEFKHVLNKQDLADIWQNTMPQIAKTPEEQNTTIEHSLSTNELLGGVDLTQYDMKAKIFKIKKRAKQNYFDLTANVEDNERFNAGRSAAGQIGWYSLNWPYDYFSLVELINIQAGEIYEN